MNQQCPFLSTVEQKVACFKECAFYEFEGNGEGCPFKKVKGHKALNIKELLSFDLDTKNDEDFEEADDLADEDNFYDDVFIKEYLEQ